MTHEEFNNLMGVKQSQEAYVKACAVYEKLGDISKEEFCAEWKYISDSLILKYQSEKIALHGRVLAEKDVKINGLMSIVRELAKIVLSFAIKDDDEELIKLCVEIVGLDECIKAKIEMGIALSEDDKTYIREVFSEKIHNYYKN